MPAPPIMPRCTIPCGQVTHFGNPITPQDPDITNIIFCTDVERKIWVMAGDPDCRPFFSESKCFSDGSETFEAVDADGNSYSSIGELIMANAKPYTPGVTITQSEKTEVRNFWIVDPAAGTVADFVSAVIADRAPAIQLPGEAAPVPVTIDDVCGWELDVLACGEEIETGEIVPEGADFAFIGGRKSSGDKDDPNYGVDVTTTFTPPPVAGSIIGFCVTFERTQQVKA